MIFLLLSIGAINALVPLFIILILIGAAAATRGIATGKGFSFFNLFGFAAIMGATGGGRGTLARQSARGAYARRFDVYGGKYGAPTIGLRSAIGFVYPAGYKQVINPKTGKAKWVKITAPFASGVLGAAAERGRKKRAAARGVLRGFKENTPIEKIVTTQDEEKQAEKLKNRLPSKEAYEYEKALREKAYYGGVGHVKTASEAIKEGLGVLSTKRLMERRKGQEGVFMEQGTFKSISELDADLKTLKKRLKTAKPSEKVSIKTAISSTEARLGAARKEASSHPIYTDIWWAKKLEVEESGRILAKKLQNLRTQESELNAKYGQGDISQKDYSKEMKRIHKSVVEAANERSDKLNGTVSLSDIRNAGTAFHEAQKLYESSAELYKENKIKEAEKILEAANAKKIEALRHVVKGITYKGGIGWAGESAPKILAAQGPNRIENATINNINNMTNEEERAKVLSEEKARRISGEPKTIDEVEEKKEVRTTLSPEAKSADDLKRYKEKKKKQQ
jgi:hypothetical protein